MALAEMKRRWATSEYRNMIQIENEFTEALEQHYGKDEAEQARYEIRYWLYPDHIRKLHERRLQAMDEFSAAIQRDKTITSLALG